MAFPLSIHVSQATLDAMLRDIVGALRQHGIRKIVIINGHGGNDFVPFVRQVQSDLPVHVFLCNWWTVGTDRYGEIFDASDDHAGEMETSVALALFPELVEQERAKDGGARPFRFEALEQGWGAHEPRLFQAERSLCGGRSVARVGGEGPAIPGFWCASGLRLFCVSWGTLRLMRAFRRRPECLRICGPVERCGR